MAVFVCVYTRECRCGCKLQARDNIVLAQGLQRPASGRVAAAAPSAADKGSQTEALSCRATLNSCSCFTPADFVLPVCQVCDGWYVSVPPR